MILVLVLDDLELVARKEEVIKSMLRRFKKYLDRKGLELNVEKLKIMIFKKVGRGKKYKWVWGKGIICGSRQEEGQYEMKETIE